VILPEKEQITARCLVSAVWSSRSRSMSPCVGFDSATDVQIRISRNLIQESQPNPVCGGDDLNGEVSVLLAAVGGG
jgi:hypothetical protein